jgi:type I restriction enzyme S subunit
MGVSVSEWEKSKVGGICIKIGSGATPTGGANSYKTSGISLIRSQNVLDYQFSFDGLAFIDDEQADKLKSVTVEDGDILLNITGDSVARSCIVPKEVLPARVNQHVSIVRVDKSKALNKYVFYYIQNIKSLLLSLAGNGGTRNALTKAMIEQLDISLPSLPEQKAIAVTLSALDDMIELNNKINKNHEEMAQAIFKSWFVDFEPFKDGEFEESELGLIPKGWRVGVLGDIIDIFDSKRVPLSSRQRSVMEKKYPYYGAATLMDYVGNYIFDGVHVLLGEDGTVMDEKGYPILQYVWGKFWVNNHAHVLKGKGVFSDEYLYILLKNTNVASIVTGAVQLKINQNNLTGLKIIIPPEDVVKQYNDIVKDIFACFRSNADEIKILISLRDTLLPKLMSGEIRVPVEEVI